MAVERVTIDADHYPRDVYVAHPAGCRIVETTDVEGLLVIRGLTETTDAEVWYYENRDEMMLPVTDMYGRVGPNPRYRIDLGYTYQTRGGLSLARMMPAVISELGSTVSRIVNEATGGEFDFPDAFDQCLINIYAKKQGIAAHVDHPDLFGPVIICVSMGGQRVMYFTRDGTRVKVTLQPGDAYVMTGPARYDWEHEMPKLASNKPCYSITYRTVV